MQVTRPPFIIISKINPIHLSDLATRTQFIEPHSAIKNVFIAVQALIGEKETWEDA